MSLHDATQNAPPAAAAPAGTGRNLGLALLVIAAAQLMLVLDDTIVNVALPSMQRSLHIATPHLNWVASFYALAFGGLLLAGALTTYLSWRWVLFINAPIAVAVLAGTGVLVAGDTEHGRLDVPGAATATLGIGSLIYALTRGATNGWTDHGTLASLAAAAALLLAFLVIERASRTPMLPSRVVRDRNRSGANTVLLLLGTGMLAMFYLLTLYMQIVRGYSPIHTGLAYLPFVVGVGLASGGLGPRLLAALPARAVIAAGMTLFAGGLAWYVATLTPTSDYYLMVPAMLAGGAGAGLTFVGCTVTGMRQVAPRDTGIAAGLLNTSLQVGSALGLAALAAIASIVTRNHLPGHAMATALTDGYVAGLLAGAIIVAAGALVALFTINARLSAAEAAGH